MKTRLVLYISSLLIFAGLCVAIGWYAEDRFELHLKQDLYDHQIELLTDMKKTLLARKSIPEEMYHTGVLLHSQGWYSEADQLLRFLGTSNNEDEEWSLWKQRAQDVLLQDDFQSRYIEGGVNNTFNITNFVDNLFDKESVRRKYGRPCEIIQIASDTEEWFYHFKDGQTGRFNFWCGKLLTHLISPPVIEK